MLWYVLLNRIQRTANITLFLRRLHRSGACEERCLGSYFGREQALCHKLQFCKTPLCYEPRLACPLWLTAESHLPEILRHIPYHTRFTAFREYTVVEKKFNEVSVHLLSGALKCASGVMRCLRRHEEHTFLTSSLHIAISCDLSYHTGPYKFLWVRLEFLSSKHRFFIT